MPYAYGRPLATARLRVEPEDFEVEEQLGFELSADGEHLCVWVEKRGANTEYVARQLADYAGIKPRDVGFCGLKDRHAVTRQWFSLGLAGKPEPEWSNLPVSEFKVLESTRHQRKLRRGIHRANRFRLRLRELAFADTAGHHELEQRLRSIAERGVPNFFGEQRFGGDNLERALAWVDGGNRGPSKSKRGLYLSVLRAWLFNRLLALRVSNGDWNELRRGDICILSGSRSFFCAEELSEELVQRNASDDIRPGLPLWGRGQLECSAERALEFEEALTEHRNVCEFLEQQGLSLDWRATRLRPDDFSWQFCDDGSLELAFGLAPGGYATSVLRELLDYTDITRGKTVGE